MSANSFIEDRERIAQELGVVKCDHCIRLCPYCPRLLAVRPDLVWKPEDNSQRFQAAPTRPPSFPRKAANFGKAIVEHAVAGFPETDEATVERRMATCQTCEHFDQEKTACKVCGCHLDIKIRWREQKCPVGKW